MDLDAQTDEIMARADLLGRVSDEPDRLTRTYLSPATRVVHEQLIGWMGEAGLRVRVDAAGNLVGRSGPDDAGAFLVGSHIDTVPDAGKFDGMLGVLLGIAAAQALRGRPLAKRLDVIAFSEEEGIRFRTPYLGSLAVTGRFPPDLLRQADADGATVADAIRSFGLNPDELPQAAYPPGSVAGFLEAHIEQGPILDSLGLALGVVPAILGQTRVWVRFTGNAGHAGTLPMELRRDALAAAAEFVAAVEHAGWDVPGLRATVGSLAVAPGAPNVVPGEARLSLDVRHADDMARRQAVADLTARADAIARRRAVDVSVEPALQQSAIACDRDLTGRLASALADLGHPPEPVPSGAGHDAAVMASFCPTAMLFVRSPGGVSHNPAETVRREDVRAALAVMLEFLGRELSR